MKTILETDSEIIVEYVEGKPIHYIMDYGSGFWFHADTDKQVKHIISWYYNKGNPRLIFEYGDAKTGQSWGPDAMANAGRIGKSTGKIKVPLLIRTSRSTGGGTILDHCVVRILLAKGKHVLYAHPDYQPCVVQP